MAPPFVPETKDELDCAQIDSEFLDEQPSETPVDVDNDFMKKHKADEAFENFSFVN